MGSCISKDPKDTPGPVGQGRAATKAQVQRAKQSFDGTSNEQEQGGSKNRSAQSSAEFQEKMGAVASEAKQDDAYKSSNGTVPEKVVKVLLLGSGESGKSTIVKQMKILHQNGYTKEELYEYKPFVYKNVLDCIKNIINAILDLEPGLINRDGKKVVDSEENTKPDTDLDEEKQLSTKKVLDPNDVDAVLNYEFFIDSEEQFDTTVAKKIKKIYEVPEVQEFIKYSQGNFYLIDSTHYFLSDIDRLTAPDYIPSVNDILRTRKKTSGIYDFRFEMGGLNIHMFDVGGQRSERKKWIHCFDNVTLIIFCVSLSEYDQVLLEENSQNRLQESLALFNSVVNSRWFARTSIVLFLNKIDVLAEKLPYSPLENHFPDYTGGNNINKAAKYILWRFTQVNRSSLNIYPHVTQATDTSNIQLVFAAVKETILENSLRDSGIL